MHTCVYMLQIQFYRTNLSLATNTSDSEDIKRVTRTSCHAPQDIVQNAEFSFTSNKVFRNRNVIKIVEEKHIRVNLGLA